MPGLLDGKVAIVTGAGQGLGRSHALTFANEGARVVINDFAPPGASNPVDAVVDEIKAAGGEAVAHEGDVADWDQSKAMVQLALDTWGQLDVLVNNAGILRDRMVFNMSEEEWDAVIRVHLKGHFCPTRHAVEHWRNQSKAIDGPVFGRIINTSSEAGLFAAVGQPNYAAAKGGIIQLTLSTAQAMARHGVTANAIAPRALTQMTEQLGGFDTKDGDFEVFAPENVSPLVAYLGSEASAKVSGQVFVVWGRQITVLKGPSVDKQFETAEQWTAANVSDALSPFYERRKPIADGFLLKY
ncbi:MAG: SDR family NAD(P)-dependent oxidoreductase [Actinobacteria bacterium]|nr:SDR family NAD(P)-dependent oxidoreductase [Actinomycetota bacterium]